jgi:hypothetical protein
MNMAFHIRLIILLIFQIFDLETSCIEFMRELSEQIFYSPCQQHESCQRDLTPTINSNNKNIMNRGHHNDKDILNEVIDNEQDTNNGVHGNDGGQGSMEKMIQSHPLQVKIEGSAKRNDDRINDLDSALVSIQVSHQVSLISTPSISNNCPSRSDCDVREKAWTRHWHKRTLPRI